MKLDYELLDFGDGRKLERFGKLLLDRPSPSAERLRAALPSSIWSQADARFIRQNGLRGVWKFQRAIPETWEWKTSLFTMELKRTEVGHLGVFPEQAKNWEWLYRQTKVHLQDAKPLRILNLFAYTGGSTLAVAAAMKDAGITLENRETYSITHLDAAENVVSWARRNANLSQLSSAPIRWIAEDARRFVHRESKRGKQYEGIILDPPSYGHGKKGEVWRLERDLPDLLRGCADLLSSSTGFVLLTVHSPGYPASRLGKILQRSFRESTDISSFSVFLTDNHSRRLPSGEGAIALLGRGRHTMLERKCG